MNVLFSLSRTLIICVFATALVVAQDQKPPSKSEVEAAQKVQAAQGLDAKLKQAEEFMKKNAKSQLRMKIAEYLALEIGDVTDGAKRLGYIDSYSKLFSEDKEKALVLTARVDALALTDKLDEAFKLAPDAFAQEPDNVVVYTQLAMKGSNAIRMGNPKYASQSNEYAGKAITMIEGNQKPQKMNEAFWNEFKSRWLPELYQSQGFIAYANKESADAIAKFTKVAELSPTNPFSYLMLGTIANDNYQTLAMEYNTSSGDKKEAMLKQAQAKMDEVIDHYAHVVALTETKPEFKPIQEQVLPALQEFYKFRRGSLDGLQQLIDKYKK